MKSKNISWKISPAFIAATTIALILGLTLLGRVYSQRRRVNADVEITRPLLSPEVLNRCPKSNPQAFPDGEVAHPAIRVREAAAMVMGLSALSVEAQLRRQTPRSIDSLLSLMIARKLLPPNITATSESRVLSSPQAVIQLRHREHPFALEAASIGRNPEDGPPIILRLDAWEGDRYGSVLLVARKRESIALPAPFATLEEIDRGSWSIEPLRDRTFQATETDSLNQWARRHATTGH